MPGHDKEYAQYYLECIKAISPSICHRRFGDVRTGADMECVDSNHEVKTRVVCMNQRGRTIRLMGVSMRGGSSEALFVLSQRV